jgi:hypothetical protein
MARLHAECIDEEQWQQEYCCQPADEASAFLSHEVITACERPHSAAELMPVLFKRRLDRHQTGFALGEALAHVHYLIGEGELDRATGDDGVDRFLRKAA